MSGTRRAFLGQGGLMAALLASTSPDARAAASGARPTTDLIRVGVIALGQMSHMSGIWGPPINPVKPDVWPMRSTRMLITHCWDSKPDVAAEFAEVFGCTAVDTYDAMVGKVDAMIFGGFYEVAWWPELTRPYLEAGIPCFINRPFAYSMNDAYEIVEMSQKYNTPILCTDERECIREAIVGRRMVESLVRDEKTIIGATSHNATAWEYPQHGTHGLYYLMAMFGLDVERVSYQANGWWKKKTPSTDSPMTWGQVTLQYGGIDIPGIGMQEEPFMVNQLQLSGNHGSFATSRIYYDGGWFDNDGHTPRGDRTAHLYYYQFPVVFEMQRMFETGVMRWSHDYILAKTKVFIAGFWSHLEHDGALVRVGDLPDDWEAPSPYPDWIDESIFAGGNR
jgi:predicted dehydrogenase